MSGPTTVTPEVVARVRAFAARGFCAGAGEPHGQVCIESALSLALGEPFSDRPLCVAKPDRLFAIALNDARWSTPHARAEALTPVGLASLGTAGTDRLPWTQRVVRGVITQILPLALRHAAHVHPDHAHANKLRDAANRCERDGDSSAANHAANVAAAARYAADADAADAAAYAAANSAAAAANSVAAAAAPDHVLRLAAQIAIDAYAAEGRHPPEAAQ